MIGKLLAAASVTNGSTAAIHLLGAEASTASSTLDLITPFVNFGIIGVLVIMFVSRKFIIPEWVLREAQERHERELAARDRDIAELKETLKAGTDMYNTQVIPAFTRSIDVNREYNELIRKQAEERR